MEDGKECAGVWGGWVVGEGAGNRLGEVGKWLRWSWEAWLSLL